MTHITTDQDEEPIIRLAYNLGVEVNYSVLQLQLHISLVYMRTVGTTKKSSYSLPARRLWCLGFAPRV